MIVIIPHPTEELFLIKTQKKLIAEFFKKEKTIYSQIPLWIPTDFETIQAAKNQIKQISVLAPDYDDEEKCIVCPVEIKTEEGILKSKLPFIYGLSECNNDEVKKSFPLTLKIFRLGECFINDNVYTLNNSIWKKL